MEFSQLGLKQEIFCAIDEIGFKEPTPIQQQAIPLLLNNDIDLIGLAATGTGKTAAFGLPMLNRLQNQSREIEALVLCPTRELCRQISSQLEAFSKYLKGCQIVSVYGGAPIGSQCTQLRRGAKIVVATPGRIKDLQSRGVADLSKIRLLVLDEADEMLNMGFEEDLTAILEGTPSEKQIALFSATLSPRVAKIAKNFLKNPTEISVGEKNQAVTTVDHFYHLVYHHYRYNALRRILDSNSDFYGIVFCPTRQTTAAVATQLISDGYKAEALHGEVAQLQRDSVMKSFKEKAINILVATDVAARGIDVNNLTHVIHYELPEDPEAYIHRSGRTGRANKNGISIAIVSPTQLRRLAFIERLVKRKIEKLPLPTKEAILSSHLEALQSRLTKFSSQSIDSDFSDFCLTAREGFENFSKEELIEIVLNSYIGRLWQFYKESPSENELEPPERNHKNSKNENRSRSRRSEYSRSNYDYDKKSSSKKFAPQNERRENFSDSKKSRKNFKEDDFEREDFLNLKNLNKKNLRNSKKSNREFSSRKGYTRFFISLGKKDGVGKKEILGYINKTSGMREISVGAIEIKPNFAFFEADSFYEETILKKCNRKKFDTKTVTVEIVKD